MASISAVCHANLTSFLQGFRHQARQRRTWQSLQIWEPRSQDNARLFLHCSGATRPPGNVAAAAIQPPQHQPSGRTLIDLCPVGPQHTVLIIKHWCLQPKFCVQVHPTGNSKDSAAWGIMPGWNWWVQSVLEQNTRPMVSLEIGANSIFLAPNQWLAPESGFIIYRTSKKFMPAEELQYSNISYAHELCLVIQSKPIKIYLPN